VSGDVGNNEVLELVQVDVAIAVGVDVLVDEIGPHGGGFNEVLELVLGDTTVAVGVNNLVEWVDLRVVDNLTVLAGGWLKLELGDLAIIVGIENQEHLINLSLSPV